MLSHLMRIDFLSRENGANYQCKSRTVLASSSIPASLQLIALAPMFLQQKGITKLWYRFDFCRDHFRNVLRLRSSAYRLGTDWFK